MNILKITLNADGTVKIDARGMKGSAIAIEQELQALAASVGGELVVEAHVHGAHAHHHGDDKFHVHE